MPDILEIRERPRLRRPIVLAGFTGWGNAGGASTGAIEYLLGDEPRPAPAAVADADSCFDFTVARPLSARGGPDNWKLILPTLGCYAIARPTQDRDLLLTLGPEPNFHWNALVRALAGFYADCGAEMVLTLGGFVGPVSHRRAEVVRRVLHVPLDVALAQLGVGETSYEGPTAFQTALLHAAHEQGVPAASLWVGAPPYVQGASPKVALALLEIVERLARIDLGLGRLRARTADWIQQIDQVLRSNPNLTAQLGRLVDLDEPAEETIRPEESVSDTPSESLPSGAEIVEELERFLNQQRRDPNEEGSGSTG
ncbi:MAG TPA: PAC2 family protein [Dehalococcoidia bacterium]|nr:PAC2 family protein [Dehalococcoidia bacterium]